jgi:hypothetical protein
MRSDLDTFGKKQWQKEIKKKLYKKLRDFYLGMVHNFRP